MKRELTAMVAGHICLDVLPTIDPNIKKPLNEVLAPGALTTITDAELSIGGAVYNVGLALAKLGVKVSLNSMVGIDEFGLIIEKKLKESDVKYILTKNKNSLTSFSIVISVSGSDRIFLHAPGANNDFSANEVNYNEMKKVDLFHFGYPPVMHNMFIDDGRELVTIFRKAKQTGVTTSLDMAMPDPLSESGKAEWKRILESVLPFVDIYAPSIEETLYMIDRPLYDHYKQLASGGDFIDVLDIEAVDGAAEKLHAMGASIVLLKCGYKGCYISTMNIGEGFGRACPRNTQDWSNKKIYEKCYRVNQVVSTTGAGDTTIAGFLASLLKGYTLEESISNATAVGALCVGTHDAISGILPLEKIVKIISDGWVKQ